MKTELTPENLEAFRERFGTFHDAVIHSVEIGIFSTSKPDTVTIKIGTHDWNNPSVDNNWVNLTFYIERVAEFVLRKSRNYENAIIFSLSIEFFNEEVYIDFFRDRERPKGPEDYPKGSTGTHLLVIGKRCFWSVDAYQERE